MGSSDLNAVDPYTYDDVPNGHTDFNLQHFSIEKDKAFIIPVLKDALAINPNLKIMATPWTAPAWMKTSNNLFGGEFINDSRYLQAYAEYFVKFFEAYKAEGITFDSFSVLNEPLLSKNDYPTMIMNLDVMKVLIKSHLGPLLRQRNIHTKLLIWDYNWSGSWYPEAVLSDSILKIFNLFYFPVKKDMFSFICHITFTYGNITLERQNSRSRVASPYQGRFGCKKRVL